jgi:uncharacterized protein (DUF1697 family)
MAIHISMLRGINVGGHRKVDMKELKALYEAMGFKKVSTYIQSGNVIFQTGKKSTAQQVAEKIEEGIFKKYQFEVSVIIRKMEELEKSILNNPFIGKRGIDIQKLHLTFLDKEPSLADWDQIKGLDRLPDQFMLVGKEIYLYCPGGYGITKLTNGFFENKLKVKATTRNWNTVNQLLQLAKT